MKTPLLTPLKKLSLAITVSFLTIYSVTAGTVTWTGAGADSNWTTSGNWSSAIGTYENDVIFSDGGGHTTLANYSVDNILNAQTGLAQMPIYMLYYVPTNRNFTTMIASGQVIYTGGGNNVSDLYIGADTQTATRGYSNIQETVSFVGTNAMLALSGTLHVGQGLDYPQSTPASTNYVTLNMSALDYFVMETNFPQPTTIYGLTIANGSKGGNTASRFLVCGQIRSYSQAAVYLAKTNYISLGNDMEIGAMSVYSNSMPCPLYLGIANTVLVGGNGSANGLVTVGSRGNTNAFMAFNPAFLGGANPPTATFASPANINGGRVTTFYVCLATGGVIPAYSYANYTGGNISVMASTLQMGTAGTNGVGALGVLTFDNGVFNVNNALVGDQTVSGASLGAAGVGVINLNASSAYGTNATLQVNNVLTLGAVTGAPTAGSAGTLNINGGTLIANVVTNNGGTATVNMTNGTWQLTATNTGLTNMTLSAFNAGGATNIIDVSFITPVLGSAYPVRFHLISATSITGASTLGVVLPASYEAGVPYAGYLDYTSNPGLVDLVLTSGPSSARLLTWTGSVADGFWDVGTTANWATNGVATIYNQLDLVTFNDISAAAQSNVDLTTTLTPYSVTVSNNATLYTLSGSGSLSGITGLTKQGTNTLIIDNTTSNSFTGGVLVSSGILQVGNNDTGGTLPIGPVVDNSILACGRTDDVHVGNAISGSGSVVSGGGGTLQLTGGNTFTGYAIATNNSILQGGVSSAFGATSGSVIIANGSTLDPDGAGTGKPVTVVGTGVNGEGAIINSGGPIYDSGGGLTPTLTLTGNTTFSYPNRWDLGGAGSTTSTLSTGGNAYNLTLNGNGSYFEWRNVVTDAKLGDIYLAAGTFGYVGTTSAGNPTNSLVISNGTTLEFYPGNANASINKQVVLQDGGSIENSGAGGASTIAGPLVLTNVNGTQYCTFEIGGTSLTLASNVSGNGILDMEDYGGTLTVNGNASAFTGGANIAYGTFIVNGAFGSGITNFAGTALAGSGNCSGYVDLGEYGGSPFYPGGSNIVGTFTAAGLTLESGSVVNMDLKSTTAVGGTNNDLVVVNGNLVANGNTIIINPVAATLANGTYVLMTFSGTFSGSFGGVQTAAPSRYILSLNVTANQVQLVVTGNPNTLVWNNGAGDALWNVGGSFDWTNLTKNIEDQFYTSDSVTFDDTISSAPNPATTITIPTGTVVYPSVVTNNSSANNYTISGAGSISGGASIVKLGTSTLTLTATNSFLGNVTIGGGTLLTGANASLGSSTTGTVYVTNGGTLDLGYSLGSKALVISGAGVNGGGALVNSIGAAIYDSPGGLVNVTLAGNATIGGATRVDFGKISPGSGTVGSGGNNYNLTVVGTSYREWDNVAFDANFGNIYVMTTNGGSVGVKGTTTLGNPTNLLSISSNAMVTLYADASNVVVNKQIMIYGGSTLQNGTGTNLILSPVVLGVNGGDNCTLNVGATSLTFTNVISGSGNLVKTGAGSLILSGANTYTGNTVITTGPLDLTNSGSISTSPDITLAASQLLDVSGRTDKTLTLSSGQTFQGSGTINGNLVVGSGATVQPGASGSGSLTVTNIVTLQGTTTLSLGATVTNTLIGGNINYGGTLNLTIVGTLAAGNSFKLFNSTKTTYAGSFASIVPATPGPGLQWNTSLLDTSGTLSVEAAATPTTFGASSVSGTNIILTGTGGTANGTYQVYSTTNAAALTNEAAAVASGTLVGSGTFDGSGNFRFTNGVNTNSPAQFFILKP